jgi:hypothetical protein
MWLVVACLPLSVLCFLVYEYLHDIIWVRLRIHRVPGTNNIELHGYDKDHYHVQAVGFGIVGKPGSAILVHVYDTDQGITGNPDHLYLSQLGPWVFTSGAGSVGGETMTENEPIESSYRAPWIDIGPKGEFGAILPVKIKDVNDLVAQYDQLVPFFASWPDKEHKRELVLTSGKRVGYYRERASRYPRYRYPRTQQP